MTTSLTTIIVGITVIVSLLTFSSEILQRKLIFNPFIIANKNEYFRFVTSGFIHADWIHLFINMFVLFSFGKAVEYYYGLAFGNLSILFFIILYLGGLITSIIPTFLRYRKKPSYNALGASGAVSAVVFASIVFAPLSKIYIYGVIGIPGIILGVAYLLYSFYSSQKGADNINHDAHLWGALYGFIYTILVKPELLVHFWNQLISFEIIF
jgi:membrane associated rhomboid family serine protease